jgi:O-antigen/teichoic acid export membrane protein
VDGEEVEILRTNHALRGIPVTSGTHTVVLRYESPYVTLGMWTTGFGTVVSIGVWIWAWLDRRRGSVTTH